MDQDFLRILSVFGRPLTNPVEFSQRLAGSQDQYLRVAGIGALLDMGAVPPERWQEVIKESRHGAVATRAFRFFMTNLEYELAQQVLEAFEPNDKPTVSEAMHAFLRLDFPHLVEINARQFLNEGQIEHLMAAADQAETAQGWRAALPWLARATVLLPTSPAGGYRLLRILETANQFDAMEKVLQLFERGRVLHEVYAVYSGVLQLHKKDPNKALQVVSKFKLSDVRGGPSMKARFCQIRAQAYESLGQYAQALKWYGDFNKQDVPQGIDKNAYLATIERLAEAEYPPLSEDAHNNHVMMVGFPRSGTTLLENALAAHPQVETFEEIPSLTRMVMQVEKVVAGSLAGDERRAAFEAARQRYYDEIARRSRKPEARVFVDKLPIRSAWIEVLEKFFPQKRYIFSVRHPYDVVLSCFKQSFTQNAAMENFRTLADACDFYDRVMSIWFGVFPDENERILYIRYEDLVEDFEGQARRALAFLGVDWHADVLNFAEAAERRGVGTPSYGKVRAGLEVGVQSSWQNYRSAFDNPHGANLQKWVDRFGYDR